MTTATTVKAMMTRPARPDNTVVISAVPHDVRETEVLSGYQPVVALVQGDTVSAEHRPHDVEDLTHAVRGLADAVGVREQGVEDVVDTVDRGRDLAAVEHHDAVHDAGQLAQQAEELDDVDR